VAKQALVLLAGLTAQEQQDLERRAPAHRVAAVLEALREIERRLLAGGRQPESDELHRIARAAQRADYPQGQS
jgi:hypothetical protein